MSEQAIKRNRGKESKDVILFGQKHLKRLSLAYHDLNELLTKGYPLNASMALVGNHRKLNKRQRMALQRACAPQQQVDKILANQIQAADVAHQTVFIDGFNLLILMESALSGAYVFNCADTTFRDLSGVHGSYKRVNKTNDALSLIGTYLKALNPKSVIWVLDQPISNSGRLKGIIQEVSEEFDYKWEIILDKNPDDLIAQSKAIGISSDSWILERVRWYNLARSIIMDHASEMEVFNF